MLFRDYWSQFQEVGANWYDGKYGYKNGWTMPLVQSLGVEGGLCFLFLRSFRPT